MQDVREKPWQGKTRSVCYHWQGNRKEQSDARAREAHAGPWEIRYGSYNAQTRAYDIVVTAEARDICTVEQCLGDGEANARLIAAAPELLKTAQDLLSDVAAHLDYYDDPDMERAAEALCKAIAKATGEKE